MKYSREEILQYVAEEDVKFIRLAFCDVRGRQKNISVMPGELERALDGGIAIDASAIAGFGGEVRSDLLLRPDPATLAPLPWRPEHGRVVRLFCTLENPDGSPCKADTRALLAQAVADAQAQGLEFSFGAEMEFYLFRRDEEGKPTGIPFDSAGYMDVAPEDRGENVRREICLTLEQMGIRPESSHHEEGPGQNEIDFRYADPLTAADQAVTFRSVVQTIAARNGLYADFSPKPLPDKPGNGMHINLSAAYTLLSGRAGEDVLPRLIAGVLYRAAEMTPVLNPSEASYASAPARHPAISRGRRRTAPSSSACRRRSARTAGRSFVPPTRTATPTLPTPCSSGRGWKASGWDCPCPTPLTATCTPRPRS